MRKESSTNTLNKKLLDRHCGMAFTLSLIGSRWKPTILWRLLRGKMRYNELRKSIPEVSERMLISQLRDLEQHGLIRRLIYPEVPPRVEYEITELGLTMESLLEQLSVWGEAHRHLS